MKCNLCGNVIEGENGICEVCGHRFSRPRQNPEGKPPVKKQAAKKKKRKPLKIFGINAWFIAVCAGLLAIVIAVPTVIIMSIVGNREIEMSNIHTLYSKTSGKTSVIEKGVLYEASIDGEIAKRETSQDGKTVAVLTQYGDLHVIKGGVIGEAVQGVRNFVLSPDGSKIAYVKSANEPASEESSTEEETTKRAKPSAEEETTEIVPAGEEEFTSADLSLFIYNCLDGESKHIENKVAPTSISLSPTGNAVCYTKSDDDGKNFDGYVCKGGVYEAVGRNTYPVAVSDDGNVLYYVKYEVYSDSIALKLFVRYGDKEEKLGEYTDGNDLSVYLNSTFTQAVFSVTGKDGNYFLWRLPENEEESIEKQKVSFGFNPIYPEGKIETVSGRAVVVPDDSFSLFAFCDNSGMASFIDKKFVCNSLSVKSDLFRIADDYSRLYYIDANEYLYVAELKKYSVTSLASHVIGFDITYDGKTVYYVDSDKELHEFSGNSDKTLDTNVHAGENAFCVTESGYFYYLKDYNYDSGTLYYLRNGGSPHKVEDAANVHDITPDREDSIYYRADYGTITGDYTLYYGSGNKYTSVYSN